MVTVRLRGDERGIPETGVASYDAAIRLFNRTHAEVSDETVLGYLKELREKGYAPESINHKIKAFKKALMIAAERSGADSTALRFRISELFKEVGTSRADVSVTEDMVLTKEELARVTSHAVPSLRKASLLTKALYQTAARASELIQVRHSDCERTKKGNYRIDIRHGKGNKQRSAFITAELFAEIRSCFDSASYLFEFRKGRPMSRTHVFRMVREAGRAAGLDGLHPHTLRHTWATLNLDRLGLHKVSRYLGHSDVSITSRFYLHGNPLEEEILDE